MSASQKDAAGLQIDLSSVFAKLGKSKKVKYASKTTLNLAELHTEDSKNYGLFIAGVVLIAAFALLIAKFAVINPLTREAEAERRYNTLHEATEGMKAKASHFDEIRMEYLSYTSAWMEEAGGSGTIVGVDREDILDLVEEVFLKRANVYSISAYTKMDKKGNGSDYLDVTMETDSMHTASDILDEIRKHPLCKNASMNTAQTTVSSSDSVVRFTIKALLQPASEGGQEGKVGK